MFEFTEISLGSYIQTNTFKTFFPISKPIGVTKTSNTQVFCGSCSARINSLDKREFLLLISFNNVSQSFLISDAVTKIGLLLQFYLWMEKGIPLVMMPSLAIMYAWRNNWSQDGKNSFARNCRKPENDINPVICWCFFFTQNVMDRINLLSVILIIPCWVNWML